MTTGPNSLKRGRVGLLLALTLAAVGCAGTPATTQPTAPVEGHVSARVDDGSGGGAPTTGLSLNTSQTGLVANAQGTLPGFVQPTTGQPGGTRVQQPAANAPVVPSSEAGDRLGTTQQLDAGQVLTRAPHLDGTATAAATPAPSATPAAGPTADTSGAIGITQPAATPSVFAALHFQKVRVFAAGARLQIIDSARAVAVDGTNLLVTEDSGASWTRYPNVGRVPLTCLHFVDAQTGVVAGEDGNMLLVSIANGTLTYQLANPLTASRIDAVYAVTPPASQPISELYYADSDARVLRHSTDGGHTWELAVASDGRPPSAPTATPTVNPSASPTVAPTATPTPVPTASPNPLATLPVSPGAVFTSDGGNGVLYLTQDPLIANGAYASVYLLQGSRFVPVSLSKSQSVTSLSAFQAVGVCADNSQPIRNWYSTTDWKSFVGFSADLATPTQLLRSALAEAHPVGPGLLLGKLTDGRIALSTDLGRTWSEPQAPDLAPGWLVPFSPTAMWGYDVTRRTLVHS